MQATSPAGKEGGIELVQPPPGSKPGERVYFEGEKYESAYLSIITINLIHTLDMENQI